MKKKSREELIEAAAMECEWPTIFKAGVEWADAHPVPLVVTDEMCEKRPVNACALSTFTDVMVFLKKKFRMSDDDLRFAFEAALQQCVPNALKELQEYMLMEQSKNQQKS
ncbi:MAG: hypothetical protein PUF37_00875 [Prevotellaceae bacterium]|nr:hypothetical protein [Prevotellaceae bacterium]